jgi:hypothetical protein
MRNLMMMGLAALAICATTPARAGRFDGKQPGIEGRAMKTVLFKNPKMAKRIDKLERRAMGWNQARPDLVAHSLASDLHLGWAVERWGRFAERRQDAAVDKLKPLQAERLAQVRAEVKANGGDPASIHENDVSYFMSQFRMELPGLKKALAAQGIKLDSLRPQDAAKLMESSRVRFNDKNQKVFSFDPVAIANAKRGVF